MSWADRGWSFCKLGFIGWNVGVSRHSRIHNYDKASFVRIIFFFIIILSIILSTKLVDDHSYIHISDLIIIRNGIRVIMNDITSVSYLQTLHAGPYSKFDFLLVFWLCLPHLGQAEPKQCQKCAKLYRDPSAICQVDICNAVNTVFTGLSQGPVIWKCFSVLSYLKLFFIYEGPLFIRNEAITLLE